MRQRLPNPWISIPSVLLGLLAAGLGWTVTYISCAAGTACIVSSMLVAVVSLVGVTIGTGLLLVLVYRSIAEWRDAEARNEPPPGPGCETPDI